MKTVLFDFQREGVSFHLAHHYSLNICQMGLGKTVQALAVAEAAGGKTLVFCPAFLEANWKNEIVKHLGEDKLKDFLIIPYSTLSSRNSGFAGIYATSWKTVIADEAHYLKTPTSKRTEKFFTILKKTSPEYFVGLTGTPIKNRVADFYTLLSAVSLNPKETSGINLNNYFSYTKFCDRYSYGQKLNFSGATFVKYTGFKPHMAQEFQQLIQGKVYSVDASKVIDLPELREIKIKVDIKSKATEAALKQEYENYILGGRSIVAKKASAILKVEATTEQVKLMQESGVDSIVVFTDHVEPAIRLASNLGGAVITGATPPAERAEVAAKFQIGQIPVLVATIGSFSVGVNLTRANHLVFNDVSWVPADNAQAMKRIHRIGQENTCKIYYIVGGIVDSFILDMIKQKMKVINQALKGESV